MKSSRSCKTCQKSFKRTFVSRNRKYCSFECRQSVKNPKIDPVLKTYRNILYRCTNPKDKRYEYYGGRGIQCRLTPEELQLIWDRDKAADMKQASIFRFNKDNHYVFSNCKFIEKSQNIKRRKEKTCKI